MYHKWYCSPNLSCYLFQAVFDDLGKAVLNIFVMTLGEIEFGDNFVGVELGPFETDVYVLLFIFLFLMPIVLMNLMVRTVIYVCTTMINANVVSCASIIRVSYFQLCPLNLNPHSLHNSTKCSTPHPTMVSRLQIQAKSVYG